MRSPVLGLALLAPALMAATARPDMLSMEGSWEMESAYEILADGTRVTNYGPQPKGLMMVDGNGRYSIQIFRRDRPSFASGVKSKGEPGEYRAAVLGSSTHFGLVSVDPARRQLAFDVQAASFPNWEGKRQTRNYSYKDGLLTYAVPAGASGDGTVAWSVWRKIDGPVRAKK